MTDNGKILFIQHNADRNSHKMHTCLDYAIKFKTDFILFQEFYIANDNSIIIDACNLNCRFSWE